MKVFLTGATGMIGRRLLQQMVLRGDEVYALVRTPAAATEIAAAGAQPVLGDITDPASMRSAMSDCDVVYHLAAWYHLGAADQSAAEQVNVQGTRNVLELAWQLGVPKIIYTSTLTVFGDTHGQLADETYQMAESEPFRTEYDRTKWLAHYTVALPLMARGAPIVVIIPGVVYGPGDNSLLGQFMRLFYGGLLPIFPGADTLLSYVHVDDLTSGLLLAATRAETGQSYILAGPTITLRHAVEIWAEISGKRRPLIYLPGSFIRRLAPLSRSVQRLFSLPPILSEDAIRITGTSYAVRSDKARQMLGWETRPLQQGMTETMDWIASKEKARPAADLAHPNKIRIRQTITVLLGAGLGLLLLWLLKSRPRKTGQG